MNEQINLIWIGGTPPILIQSNLKKWQDVYGSRVKVWDNQSVQRYTEKLDATDFHPAKLADICRVFILKEFAACIVTIRSRDIVLITKVHFIGNKVGIIRIDNISINEVSLLI